MQKYEMLILLRSDMEEEAREAELNKFAGIVTSMGGEVEATDKWGTRRTAYPIQYKSDAFFALMTFRAPAKVIAEIERVAGISGNVLRRMITKIEEK
ncbi:MAG: 30S ribosomal protein S6 [Clostridia bacterium]|nr:30S ribosomal protein S6 [Clostridia bacterium]